MRSIYTFICLIVILIVSVSANGMVLVEDGRPMSVIVLPSQPTGQEQSAAEDLQTYLEKMSGAVVPIVDEPAPQGNAIMIGRTEFALKHCADGLTREKLGYEGFLIKTIGNRLVLVGLEVPYRVPRKFLHSGHGTRHAVFDLLERLGCRFFAFHEDGEHIPQKRTISAEQLDISSKPDFEFRRMHFTINQKLPSNTIAGWKSWSIKNRLGGPFMIMNHNYSSPGHPSTSPRIVPEREKVFAEHPEYFALVTDEDGVQRRMVDKQLCLSNPEVLDLAISSARRYFKKLPDMPAYSLSSNDLQWGWCECEKCVAWDDPDPTVGLATRVLRFNNLVAKAMEEEFPDKHYLYYAEYSNMPGPPVRDDGTVVLKAHPAVVPVYNNIYCLIHDVADPSCPRTVEHRRRIEAWDKVARDVYVYEWYQWTSSYSIPMNWVIGPRIRYYRDHGVTGYYVEGLGHSPDNTLSMYIASKMLWDADQDPNALLDDFFRLYFQEAAEPMRSYYRFLNECVLKSTEHGARLLALRPNTKYNIAEFLDLKRVGQLKKMLGRAQGMAKKPIVRRRLEREAKALRQYENEARIQYCYRKFLKQPTDANARALRQAIGQDQAFYPTIPEIVLRQSSRRVGWLKRVKKGLDKP